eukprot:1410818-Rhodomonas_salina.1
MLTIVVAMSACAQPGIHIVCCSLSHPCRHVLILLSATWCAPPVLQIIDKKKGRSVTIAKDFPDVVRSLPVRCARGGERNGGRGREREGGDKRSKEGEEKEEREGTREEKGVRKRERGRGQGRTVTGGKGQGRERERGETGRRFHPFPPSSSLKEGA